MITQTELNHIPEPQDRTALVEKINQAFEQFAKEALESLGQELQILIKMELSTAKQNDKTISNREAEYRDFDLNRRISALTNNFYTKWPGGIHREATDARLIKDLDEIIHEKKYDDIVTLVQVKNSEGENQTIRMMAIADVFLEMCSRGWSREELRK